MKNINTSRKKFIQLSSMGMLGLLMPNISLTTGRHSHAVIVHADEGETYWIGRRHSPLTIFISKTKHGQEQLCLCMEEIAPGEGIPIHKHLNEDELIFIHSGKGSLLSDEEEMAIRVGSSALIPKSTWHGIKNTGEETMKMMFSYSPAGFEGYFREFGSVVGTPWEAKPKEVSEMINRKWGIVYYP